MVNKRFSLARRWLIRFSLLLAAVFMSSGCMPIAGGIAESIYPALPQPNDTELPSTFTTFPASSSVEAVLGGQGAGLDCSIPAPISALAFSRNQHLSNISLRFRQSCVMHDLCYRHGYATYGYSQADCDFQLQQSAYRLCRQIYKADEGTKDPLNLYSICEKEAKKVLLGVRLGGAGSFRDQRSSTYFEYDPVPLHADNYVVARAIDLPPGPSGNPDIGIRTFHFQRNSVTMRVIERQDSGSVKKSTPQIFPDLLIATPPVYAGITADGGDSPLSLVALARKNMSSSAVKPVFYQLGDNASDFRLITCKTDPANGCVMKSDASISHISRVNHEPRFINLSTRNDEKVPPGTKCESKQPGDCDNKKLAIIPARVFHKQTQGNLVNFPLSFNKITSLYRFTSHDILLEKNHQNDATHVWVFGRGIGLQNNEFTSPPEGNNYRTEVAIARQTLDEGKPGVVQRFIIEAKEEDEPFSLIRMGQQQETRLLSMAWSKQDLSRFENNKQVEQPPYLKIWRLSPDGQTLKEQEGIKLPLNADYRSIIIPPVIARFSMLSDPVFIATEVECDRWQVNQDNQVACHNKQPDDGKLAIHFRLFQLHAEAIGEVKTGRVTKLSCDINLDKQFMKSKDLSAQTLSVFADLNTNSSQSNEMKKNYSRSVLAQRWRMSQVIIAERNFTDIGPAVALSVVFNGYPGMTLPLLLRPNMADGDVTFSILPQSPLPDFAMCWAGD